MKKQNHFWLKVKNHWRSLKMILIKRFLIKNMSWNLNWKIFN